MINQYTAFTLIESMLALLLSSLLVITMIAVVLDLRQGYQRIMTTAYLLDAGRMATLSLSNRIHQATHVIKLIPKSQLSALLKQQLKSQSDVLILQLKQQQVAYYLATTYWTHAKKPIYALFEKPFSGLRRELVPHVMSLHFKQEGRGIAFSLTLQLDKLKQQWHSFAIVGKQVADVTL